MTGTVNRAVRTCLLTALVGCSTGADAAPLPAQQVPDGFWDHWGDGRAELAAYELAFPRYGEVRRGKATLVTVSQRFDDAQRVKPEGRGRDSYPVLKQNLVMDFQTGIYDYNVMTSTFLRLDGGAPLGEPVKVSMSMQEWCGHVYEQLIPRGPSGPEAERPPTSGVAVTRDREGARSAVNSRETASPWPPRVTQTRSSWTKRWLGWAALRRGVRR